MSEISMVKFRGKTMSAINRVRQATAIKLFSAVVLDSPVLTGRLRGNWILSQTNPADSITENSDPTGSVTIATMTAGVESSPAIGKVWFTNNLPYAYRIEFDGWSHTKAPAGMVRKNVQRFADLLQKEAARTR